MNKENIEIRRNIVDLPQIFIDHDQPQNPIIFVHGFNSSHQNPHLNFGQIYNKHDYYSLTFPGNNKTPAFEEELTPRYYAKILIKFIEEKQLKNVIAIGHSMGGGTIALAYKLRPDLFSKMIFIAPMNKTSLPLAQTFKDKFFPKNLDELRELVRLITYDKSSTEEERWKELNKHLVFDADLFTNPNIVTLGNNLPNIDLMNDIEKGLDSIKVPSLLILGEEDGIMMRDEAKNYFEEHVKGIEVVIIEKCGHSPFVETPDTYYNIIDNFLNKE